MHLFISIRRSQFPRREIAVEYLMSALVSNWAWTSEVQSYYWTVAYIMLRWHWIHLEIRSLVSVYCGTVLDDVQYWFVWRMGRGLGTWSLFRHLGTCFLCSCLYNTRAFCMLLCAYRSFCYFQAMVPMRMDWRYIFLQNFLVQTNIMQCWITA